MTYPVLAERFGNRIRVRWERGNAQDFGRHLAAARAVTGAHYADSYQAWTYPLTLTVCRDLRAAFGRDLGVGAELAAWARTEIAREQATGAVARAGDAALQRLPVDAPELAAVLRPYQTVAARFICEAREALIGDDPGMGKTLEAIAGIIESGASGRHLVVAKKKALVTVWQDEVTKWMAGSGALAQVFVASGDATRRRRVIEMANEAWRHGAMHVFLIINGEMLRTKERLECTVCGSELVTAKPKDAVQFKIDHREICQRQPKVAPEHSFPQLHAVDWSTIIVDESHRYIQNPGTQTAVGAKYLTSTKLRMALSGTPMTNRPQRLFGTLQWLRPKQYTSKWNFIKSYWEVTDGDYALEVGELRPEREAALQQALGSIMLRRQKTDHGFPVKAYVSVWCELDPRQRKVYDALVKDGSARLAEGGAITPIGVLDALTRLQQFATAYGHLEASTRQWVPSEPSGKLEALLTVLEEHGISGDAEEREGGHKLIVASQWNQVLDLVARRLTKEGIPFYQLDGRTKDRDVIRVQREFNADGGHQVFLMNTVAGGESINLDAAGGVVFMDETWNPDQMTQATDRAQRSPGKHVVVFTIRAKDTIDEYKQLVVAAKDVDITRILDGPDAVAFLKGALEGVPVAA